MKIDKALLAWFKVCFFGLVDIIKLTKMPQYKIFYKKITKIGNKMLKCLERIPGLLKPKLNQCMAAFQK